MADRTWTGRLLLKGEDRGISKSAQKVETAVGGVANKLKQFGALAAVAGAGALFVGSVQKIKQFEKSISDLSAITGAAGADLDKLTEASKQIGRTTTLSASQAAEAFKLIASAKPDLLENVAALDQTTRAAVTLAEAAGLDLPTAASALGESLNQFGEGAQSADKFINILAAGAKFGASEISETSAALVNAGTTAKLAGLSFEETNAAIQGLAAAGLKGSIAGSKLRSVLTRLQVQANDDFNPTMNDLNTVLDNLAEANLSVTEKTKIFGIESVNVIDTLVAQRETIAGVTDDITGTSEAYDQASARVDNLDGDIKRLMSAFEAFQLNLANGNLPVLRELIQVFTNLLLTIDKMSASGQGINKADEGFNTFAETLKAVFTAGNIVKNFFDTLFDSLVFVGRAIVSALQGDFDLIDDHFAELKEKTRENGDDIAQFVFRTYNEEAAAELDRGTESLIAAATQQVATVQAAVQEVALSAGQEAADALAAKEAAQAAKEEQAFEDKLERFRLSNQTELQALIENHQLKLAEIQLLEDNTIFLEDEANEKRLAADQAFTDARAEIARRGATDLQKFEMLNATNKTKFVLSEATKLTQGVAQNNKTMFKINKVAAIANAVINTGQAITRTMADYPFPVNIALAALTAAAGFAQIQSIRSTQFSGGGTGTTPSAAGSVPVVNNQPTGGANEVPIDALLAGQGGGGVSQRIDINIDGLNEGGLISADATRTLIESINDQLGDGVNLNVDGGSNGTGD